MIYPSGDRLGEVQVGFALDGITPTNGRLRQPNERDRFRHGITASPEGNQHFEEQFLGKSVIRLENRRVGENSKRPRSRMTPVALL